jgi:hypothetical protein
MFSLGTYTISCIHLLFVKQLLSVKYYGTRITMMNNIQMYHSRYETREAGKVYLER